MLLRADNRIIIRLLFQTALPEMAEAFQMSGRTLQRRLKQCGRSYSDVVQEARFELARELLVDPSTRIIDVALATGYENQQHFARAFRWFAACPRRVSEGHLPREAEVEQSAVLISA
jgi:transcriptional regulator GlxA family with amidase domain